MFCRGASAKHGKAKTASLTPLFVSWKRLNFLCEQLGVKVDVVLRRNVRSEKREGIFNEAVPI